MDFRQLKYFVAVAEELHFGKAAMRLHVSQPPLSQQIKGLEIQLGVQLFERNRRSVRLTPAGVEFLRHAYDVLRAADVAAQAARRAATGEVGEVGIGYSASALYSDVVLQAIVRYRKCYPAVNIRLVEGTTPSSVRDLEAGRIDTAFVRGPLPAALATWRAGQVQLISSERLMVALPKRHELASRRGIALKELRDEHFVALARHMGTALNDLLDRLFEDARIPTSISIEATDIASLLGLVGAGAGISIVPTTVAHYRSRYIVFRPLTDHGASVDLFHLLPVRPVPTAEKLRLCLSQIAKGV